MNERIQKLAHEAGLPTYNPDGIPTKLEKFAELIVRECVAICQDIDGEDNTDARSGRQDCAVEIREHFGLEQIRKCDVCDCMYPCSTSRNEKPWD